jgi:hypothetical protein
MIVHTWSVADHDLKGQRIRLILGVLAGLGLIVWLSWSVFSAGLIGLAIFGFTALIAYAANARQVNKVGHALPPRVPKIPEQRNAGTVLLLLTSAEPAHYNGPAYWAWALRQYPLAPHWFLWPRKYARIRQAYRAMGGTHPLDATLSSLLSSIGANLNDSSSVRYAYLGEERSFLAVLVKLAEEGFSRLILASLEDESGTVERLRDLVTRAGIIDNTLDVTYVRPLHLSVTAKNLREERLARLLEGKAVTLANVDSSEVKVLVAQLSGYSYAPASSFADRQIQDQGW